MLLLVKFFFRTSCHKKTLIRSIFAACKVNDYSFKVLLQTVLSTPKIPLLKNENNIFSNLPSDSKGLQIGNMFFFFSFAECRHRIFLILDIPFLYRCSPISCRIKILRRKKHAQRSNFSLNKFM